MNSRALNEPQRGENLVTENPVLSIAPPGNYRYRIVELSAIDERVKKLCAKAANAREDEVEEVLAELREALKEHARFVRFMASKTLIRMHTERSPSSPTKGVA